MTAQERQRALDEHYAIYLWDGRPELCEYEGEVPRYKPDPWRKDGVLWFLECVIALFVVGMLVIHGVV